MADAIRKRIALEDDLRDDHILVDVANHAVFLSGTVSSNSDRTRAQDLVQFASCRVASIVNDLSSAPSDQAIDLEARRRLAADHELQHQPIRVGVSSGVIVLSGSVSEHPMRSNAGTLMAGIPGLHNVINNLDVVEPSPQPPNVRGYGAGTHLPLKPPLSNNLTGSWTGTYMSCSQATTPASATIQDSGVDDITASLRIEIPGAIPGSLTMHGVLAPLNGHLTLTFNGWEHQPPGVSMGNVGGYVSFTPAGATSFTGTIFGPGCGTLTLHRALST
jgi:osmotically-inducible protein OsmY